MDYRHIADFFAKKITRDNISAYAAQATLFIIMSIVPFLMVLLWLLRFTPLDLNNLISVIEVVIPSAASGWLEAIVKEVYHTSGTIIIFLVVYAVYSSAKCIHSLRNGLNTVYEVHETRNWFKLRLRAMLDTFLIVWMILITMLLLVFGQKLQNILEVYFPNAVDGFALAVRFRLVIIFFFLILFFDIIYMALPNRPAKMKSQLVGAIGCSAAWYVFSFGLSIVINFFNGFSWYGSLTTLCLIMFWLYICLSIFLICGEVNNAIEMIIAEWQIARARKKAEKERLLKEQEEQANFVDFDEVDEAEESKPKRRFRKNK